MQVAAHTRHYVLIDVMPRAHQITINVREERKHANGYIPFTHMITCHGGGVGWDGGGVFQVCVEV